MSRKEVGNLGNSVSRGESTGGNVSRNISRSLSGNEATHVYV